MSVEVLEIPSRSRLDAITVFWQNFAPGQGSVTFTCWGSAWTVYFGAMGGETIQQFFSAACTGYLVDKVCATQWLKKTKQHENYVGRIIEAIKTALSDAQPPAGQ